MRLFLLTMLTAFSLLAMYLYHHLGFSKSAQVLGTIHRDFHLLKKDHVGPYHQINSTIEAVEKFARENGVNCGQTFGRFLDDPDEVESERLRSEVGCVLPGNLPADLALEQLTIQRLDDARYLQLRFEGSPSIGPIKVYPMAEKWALENKTKIVGPVIETYQQAGDRFVTDFFFPLESQPH